ncbi:MAG: hypothetical protein JNM94_02915 [Phycisphaerae bacterium]|nr:hypothetical protein [Phycisphaerae bacterium]
MDGTTYGMDVAARRNARRIAHGGGWGGLAIASIAALSLVGCDCKRERDRMTETLSDGYEDAFRCCQEVAAIDPDEGIACFASLVDWRMEVTQLIIAWYQACIDGNSDLARDLLDMAKSIFVSRFGADCPMVALGPDGQPRTAGLVFSWADDLDVRGRFVAVAPGDQPASPARVGPLDAALSRYVLDDGAFRASIGGMEITGGLTGALTLGAARPDGARPIVDARLSFATAAGTVAMQLANANPTLRDLSAVRPTDDGPVLAAHVTLSIDESLPILAPASVWLELPLRERAGGFTLDGGPRPLRAVLPPALGFADWDQDGAVTIEDWTAYFDAAADTRDLDLDGDQDVDDDALFVASFRRAVPTHGS